MATSTPGTPTRAASGSIELPGPGACARRPGVVAGERPGQRQPPEHGRVAGIVVGERLERGPSPRDVGGAVTGDGAGEEDASALAAHARIEGRRVEGVVEVVQGGVDLTAVLVGEG